MSAIKSFDEFIKTGVVKKQSIDKPRAQFLVEEAEKSYRSLLEMVEKLKMNNDNANTYVKICHDILMELIRAKMLLEGYNATGYGAHEAEVSYMRELGFDEKDVQFADQMRFFRNGILYYGTTLDQEYAEKVIKYTKMMFTKLKKLVKR